MSGSTPANEHYIAASQLCIGLHVELELGWMDHPFTFSSFKIKSQEQIDLIKTLALQRIRFNPKKSSSQPLPVPEASATPASVATDRLLDEMRERKQASIEELRRVRSDIERMESRFTKVADTVKSITRNLQFNPQEAVKDATNVVTQMVEVMMTDGDLMLHALGDKLGEDTYFHSLNVAVLSLMLCKAAELPAETMQQVGLGALLHDIGKAEIPYKVTNKTEPLTTAEMKLLKMHPEFGLKMAAKLGLSPEVYSVILMHHEYVDGSGYPKGLRDEQILLAAKVVAIANDYDNLCNPVNIANALSPSEALSQLFALRRAKFDDRLLRLFIKRLGIYPPGSLVALSNDTIGLVVSVNTAQPLKPNVMVYDGAVPKEDALIIKLENDPDLKVVKSLRPAQLPRVVHQYLNPRKNITYFVDAKTKTGK